MLPLQDGDVIATYADVAELIADTGYKPDTPLEDGVSNFAGWFLDYYDY
jgi:UDP-glucuronate 4-epimerase